MRSSVHIALAFVACLWWATPSQAQRIAFVDIQYVLDQMPEYHTAQAELDRVSGQWQAEIEERYDMIERMQSAFNAEAILLTEEMKRTRLDEIERRKKEARELQKKRFGVEGDLFRKRQELIQPIQDQVYQAVKEVAGTSYIAVFDISGNSNLLFASEKYDKSDSVLRKLGIRPGEGGEKPDRGGAEEPEEKDEEGAPPERGGTTPPQRGGDTPTIKPNR